MQDIQGHRNWPDLQQRPQCHTAELACGNAVPSRLGSPRWLQVAHLLPSTCPVKGPVCCSVTVELGTRLGGPPPPPDVVFSTPERSQGLAGDSGGSHRPHGARSSDPSSKCHPFRHGLFIYLFPALRSQPGQRRTITTAWCSCLASSWGARGGGRNKAPACEVK